MPSALNPTDRRMVLQALLRFNEVVGRLVGRLARTSRQVPFCDTLRARQDGHRNRRGASLVSKSGSRGPRGNAFAAPRKRASRHASANTSGAAVSGAVATPGSTRKRKPPDAWGPARRADERVGNSPEGAEVVRLTRRDVTLRLSAEG